MACQREWKWYECIWVESTTWLSVECWGEDRDEEEEEEREKSKEKKHIEAVYAIQ